MTLNVLDIVKGTTVDGPGFRTAIYLAGCSHGCPGCHNPQSHDPSAGVPMSIDEIMAVVEKEDFDVTLTGGDPLYNVEAVSALVSAIKGAGYGVWLYTGFTWEQILESERLVGAIKDVDVVVDGRFVERLKDSDLLFRGSSNQRLVDVQRSLLSGRIAIWSRS